MGCSDVEERRQDTIDNLYYTSQEMEDYVRSHLKNSNAQSLAHPTLLIAMAGLIGDEGPLEKESLAAAEQISIIVVWIEAFPSVNGIKLTSPEGDINLSMTKDQIALNKETAKRLVVFAQSFRLGGDSSAGKELKDMLRNGEVVAVLTRDGRPASGKVRLTYSGEHWGAIKEGGTHSLAK